MAETLEEKQAKYRAALQPDQSPRLLDQLRAAEDKDEREKLINQIKAQAESVDVWNRFKTKVKATDQGALGFLEHQFGKGNVIPVEGNNFIIDRGAGKKPLVLEGGGEGAFAAVKEAGLDILDIVPEIGEGIAGAFGAKAGAVAGAGAGTATGTPGLGTVTGALVGGATGALAGRKLRQIVSGWLPGEDFDTAGEAALDLGTAAATDVVGAGVGAGLGALGRSATQSLRRAAQSGSTPAQLLERSGAPAALADDPLSPLGRETAFGDRLATEPARKGAKGAGTAGEEAASLQSRVRLDPAEQTLSRKAVEEKNILEKLYPEVFDKAGIRRQQGFTELVDNELENLRPLVDTAEGFARLDKPGALKRTLQEYQKRAGPQAEARKQAADALFAEARALDPGPWMETGPAIAAIEALEKAHPKSVSPRLLAYKEQLQKGITTAAYQDMLHAVGKATRGGLSFVKDADRTVNKGAAKKLYTGLLQGLTQSAQSDTISAEAARKLLQARAGYKSFLEFATATERNFIARKLKAMAPPKSNLSELSVEALERPDGIARGLTSDSLSDTQVKKLLTELDGYDKAAANVYRAEAVESLFKKSAIDPGKSVEAMSDVKYDFGEFASSFFKNESRLQTLLANNPAGYSALKQLAEDARRIQAARPEVFNASTPADLVGELVGNPRFVGPVAAANQAPAGAAGAIGTLTKLYYKLVTHPRQRAEIWVDPVKSRMLLGVLKAPAENYAIRGRLAAKLLTELGDTSEEGSSERADRAQEDPTTRPGWGGSRR